MNKIKTKGITLISLVITIVILLILAGISIQKIIGDNGLFEKAKLANKNTRYGVAKETVNLQLMEIQADCTEENEEYNIVKIAEGMEKTKDITIEKYYNKEIASIRDGITKNTNNLEGIIVSVNKYSEYKFLIGENCKITSALKEEITEITEIRDFIDIQEFEAKLLNSTVSLEQKKYITTEGISNYWPLDRTLENKISGGQADISSAQPLIYENGGVNLENNYLTINLSQNFTTEWTLTCEYMPVKTYENMAWILGWVNAIDSSGSYIGILYANSSLWIPHITYYGSIIDLNKLKQNEYNTIVLTYDKSYLKCYINGEYCGKGTSVIGNYPVLNIGGWAGGSQRTNGYYKNIAYYQRILTETEIQNY